MKKLLISLTLLLSLMAGFVLPAQTAFAAATDSAKSAVCDELNKQVGGDCGGDTGLEDLVRTVINIMSAIGGIAAVIMIIVSGFKLITSGGDSQGVAGAKKSLIYAIIGLLVVVFAQILVRFVIFTSTQ